MANTLTEEAILNMLDAFKTVKEAQLAEMLKFSPTKVRRTVHRLWKKDQVRIGGPDNGYVINRRSSEVVDVLYVDCIWVMLAHTDKEEDLKTAYPGKDVIKLTYFSREKQNSYHFIYVADEEDYMKIPYINNRFINMTEDDLVDHMKFIFVSDSETILKGLPLEKFKFPSICMQILFPEGRENPPLVKQVVRNGVRT